MNSLLLRLALTLTLLLTACGGGGGVTPAPDAADGQGLALQVLPASYLDQAPTGSFSLVTARHGDELVVEITARDVSELKALYFSLAYDSARLNPRSAEASGLLQRASGSAMLTLSVLTTPGTVYCGQVLPHFESTAGFSGDGVLATVRFDLAPYLARATSDPPTSDESRTQVQWDSTTRVLSWDYACQGDYDQDGYVGISDLTPLGRYFNQTGPFDHGSALDVIDGNQDGAITINDITAIGANFQRSVSGYQVFQSTDPGQLPSANSEPPAVPPFDFVPFEDAAGSPALVRLTFAREYPELNPNVMLWVRPASDELVGTPSTVQNPSLCQWRIRNISSFATVPGGVYNSLSLIGGLPAVSYRDSYNLQVVYQRAQDISGVSWTAEAVADSGSDVGYFTSLAEVDGRPALCHYDMNNGDLRFVRANDVAGLTWGAAQVVDSAGDVGFDCQMLLVDAQPAILYQDLTNGVLKYVRAQDPAGTVWGAPVTIASHTSGTGVLDGGYASLALIGGTPAVAFFDSLSGSLGLKYVRANDPLGASWGAVETIAAGADEGRYCSLCDVDGAPAVAYRSAYGLAYIRATNPSGSAWGSPVILDSNWSLQAGSQTAWLHASLAVVQGRPAISYYSGGGAADLRFVRALDAPGQRWGTPVTLDGPDQVGTFSNLINVGSEPAISYYNASSGQLMYVSCVGDQGNLAPVAILDAPEQAIPAGSELLFDAGRSYDPDGVIEVFEWDWDGDLAFDTNTGPEPLATHLFPTAGFFQVSVRAVDSQGESGVATVYLQVGAPNQAPDLLLSAEPRDPDLNQTIVFDASDSVDPDGTIALYEWDLDGDGDFEVNSGADPVVNYEYTLSGVYTVQLKATDNLGLAAVTAVCIVAGGFTQRPVAALAGNPLQGNPAFEVYLDAAASQDPDGSIVKYEWDCNDDGIYEYDTGSSPQLVWLCELPGDQRLWVKVTDNQGATDTTWVLCSGNQSPIARIAATPKTGKAPFLVTFDGSTSSDADGAIVAYAWDLFDDGTYESSGTGPPTTWACEMLWNGPITVRLRVTDDMGAKGSATTTIDVNKGWHVSTLDFGGNVGWQPSLKLIYGQPAIAYYDHTNRTLKYIRASDNLGINPWNPPTTVGVIMLPNYGLPQGISLAYVNGTTPGVVFAGALYNSPSYVLAKNGQGSAWNNFVIALPGGGLSSPCQEIIAGNPAFATHTNGIAFVRAKDFLGTTWNNPVIAAKTPGALFGGDLWLAIVNGNPAIAYTERVPMAGYTYLVDVLKYVRATDDMGGSWGTPVMIDDQYFPGESVHLAIIGGNPAVAYVAQTATSGFEVRYKRASDPNGASWTSPAIQVADGGREVIGLVERNGKPAVCLVTCSDHDVRYFEGSNASGATWPLAQLIDGSDQNIGGGLAPMGGSMILVNDQPAIAYTHSVLGDLKYAYWEP